MAENRPENGSPGQIGTGVHAESIRRAFDSFVEDQLLASRERLGEYTASSNALARLEPLFGDANNQGIGASLNDFFGALQDVATNPSDLSARTVFLSKATALAGQFNQSATVLTDAQQSIDHQVGQTITDVNRLTSQIAGLNIKIAGAESSGQQANDLRDERGVALADLAERIEISSIEDATGQVTVFAGRGQVLVDKDRTYQLVGVPDLGNNGLLDVRYDAGAGPTTSLGPVIQSGRLKGLLDARDQTIPSLRSSLDTLASELVTQVNQQHRLGFGLDGSTQPGFLCACRNDRQYDCRLVDQRPPDRGIVYCCRSSWQQCECLDSGRFTQHGLCPTRQCHLPRVLQYDCWKLRFDCARR